MDICKEELIEQLEALQQEHNELKALYEKDIATLRNAEVKLKLSEERYHNLFDQTNEGLILLTKDGKLVEVNKSFATMHGYTVDELKNIDIRDLDVLREGAFEERADIMQRIDAGEVVHFEVEHYHKDGHIIKFSDSASLINIGDQQYYLAFHQDISERKGIEESLKESESSLNEAQNIGKIGSWQLDLINNKAKWSRNCFIIYGLEPDEIEPSYEYFKSRVHPDDLHIIDETFEYISTFRTPINIEIRILFPDGKENWAQINIAPIVIEDELVALNGTQIDITDRKQAEEKIREKDIQFRKLSSNLPDLIFQFTRRPDGSYFVPIASDGIKNIFGCSAEEVVDDFAPIGRVIFPEDSERVISDIEYSAKHMTYFSCEFRVQIPGKPIQWIFSRSTPEKLADGSITWYGFNADITEMKQTEIELVRAKEKAEESDRLKLAFLANMSHEIRTPMNGILGFADLLKTPNLSGDEQQRYIEIIEKSGARMLSTINDIIDISRIESGKIEVYLSEIIINDLIENICAFFKPEAEKKGITIFSKTSLFTKESFIKTDRDKIIGIFSNLVKNAIKFTTQGSITVGYEKKGNILEFFVKDTGKGIRQEHQQLIFERFMQAEDGFARGFEGSGLGLSISKAYAEILGGELWVESEYGIGSTFYFTIPYDAFNEERQVLNIEVPYDGVKHQINNLKILIVDDNEQSEMLLSIAIEMFSKVIFKAKNGIEAVECCRAHADIDLVFMDIKMPEMDGYEATRQIRQFNTDVVIIAQTAYVLMGDKEKAIAAGCNDYVAKPLNIAVIQGLMQKHFGK